VKIDTQMGNIDLTTAGQDAARYERLGFDGIWTYEISRDPYFPIVPAALATSRVNLGTNLAIAFARSPFSTAMSAWDLQRLTGGRFLLGLGTQVRAHVEHRFSMPFEHPARRIKEFVQCMRAVWDTFQNGTKPAFEGEFYQFKLINPMFNPGPIDHPHIPVYLAGVNPTMCRAAGEVADGFHVHPFHSVAYLREVVLAKLDEGARTRGKGVGDMELSCPVFAVTGETQAEMDRMFEETRRQISFYASTPSYRAVFTHMGLEGLGKELSQLARNGDWDGMAKRITDDIVERVATVAKPADLARALRQRYAGILTRVSLYYPNQLGDQDAGWTRFIQAFRAA
jgi:probable F420-dependent oxidoreductase